MRKIVLLLSTAAVLVAALGVVPVAAAKKHKEDSAGNGTADENGNDVSGGGSGSDGSHKGAVVANDHDGQRFTARYAGEEPAATVTKHSSKQHNAKLLNRLGMKRVRTSGDEGGNPGSNGAAAGNHHRKRLAGQSRSKYGAADSGKGGSDSQMFVVKLPPHAHYYGDSSAAAVAHQKTAYAQQPYKSLNTVPVGFVSNGKPAKVYHWNLPAVKHAMQHGGNRYRSGGGAANDVALQQQQLQLHQYGDFDALSSSGSKVVPRRTLYYKPRAAGKPVKKSFVNNGKPNGFYVVSPGAKNTAAPQYHKIVKAYYGDD